jgi:hypothetical protein
LRALFSICLGDWLCDFLGFVSFCSQYLSELLAEHHKLGPFMQVLPICSRLLNQGEIFSFF